MRRYLMALFLIAGLSVPARAGFVADAAADFSATMNPNGPWQYGWTATLGSAFNLYSTAASSGSIDYWYDPSIIDPFGGVPGVYHNPTAGTVFNSTGTVSLLPGQLDFHPGRFGQYSVVRFIVPEAVTLSLSSAFTGRALDVPTSTDVHVLHNGVSIFDGNVTAFGVGPSFSATFSVAAGDVIDFTVGFGNGNYFSDSTSIDAQLVGVTPGSAVPEPASLALFGAGMASALVYVRRRRRPCLSGPA
jgi:hypothetical protein